MPLVLPLEAVVDPELAEAAEAEVEALDAAEEALETAAAMVPVAERVEEVPDAPAIVD